MLIETLKQKLKPNFIGEVCSQNSIHFFITEFDKHTNTHARTNDGHEVSFHPVFFVEQKFQTHGSQL